MQRRNSGAFAIAALLLAALLLAALLATAAAADKCCKWDVAGFDVRQYSSTVSLDSCKTVLQKQCAFL